MHKKIRVRLEPDTPVFIVDHARTTNPVVTSLELVDFEAKNGRIAWTVKTGTGRLLSGLVRNEIQIPEVPKAWISLYIPVCLHLKAKGFAPDFIVGMPGSHGIVTELRHVR